LGKELQLYMELKIRSD